MRNDLEDKKFALMQLLTTHEAAEQIRNLNLNGALSLNELEDIAKRLGDERIYKEIQQLKLQEAAQKLDTRKKT